MFKWSFSENWLKYLKEGLQLLQVDVDAVFNQVVVELEEIPGETGRPARVNHGAHRVLWEAIESVSGDPDIGLHWNSSASQQSVHSMIAIAIEKISIFASIFLKQLFRFDLSIEQRKSNMRKNTILNAVMKCFMTQYIVEFVE